MSSHEHARFPKRALARYAETSSATSIRAEGGSGTSP